MSESKRRASRQRLYKNNGVKNENMDILFLKILGKQSSGHFNSHLIELERVTLKLKNELLGNKFNYMNLCINMVKYIRLFMYIKNEL